MGSTIAGIGVIIALAIVVIVIIMVAFGRNRTDTIDPNEGYKHYRK